MADSLGLLFFYDQPRRRCDIVLFEDTRGELFVRGYLELDIRPGAFEVVRGFREPAHVDLLDEAAACAAHDEMSSRVRRLAEGELSRCVTSSGAAALLEDAEQRLRSEMRENPGAKEADHIDGARETFRMWHKKEPRRERWVKNAIDPTLHSEVVCVGKPTEIIYSSDKWEKDGDFHDYIHDFDDPKLYVPARLVDAEDAVGRARKTTSFLGTSALQGKKALAQLAKVRAVVYIDKHGEEKELRLAKEPPLLSSPDRKSVIILDRYGPMFISGGRMRVKPEGIVH